MHKTITSSNSFATFTLDEMWRGIWKLKTPWPGSSIRRDMRWLSEMMSSDQASWRLLSPANYNFERWIQKKSCSDNKILLMQINATVKIIDFFFCFKKWMETWRMWKARKKFGGGEERRRKGVFVFCARAMGERSLLSKGLGCTSILLSLTVSR